MILPLILLPFAAAIPGVIFGKKAKYEIALSASVLEFVLALLNAFLPVSGSAVLGDAFRTSGPMISLYLMNDGFRKLYALIIAFMWMMTLLFSRDYFRGHHNLERYFFFTMMTLGATMGVFFAGDLYTAFVFFEIMSFTSFPWVIQEETDGAVRAANTYLAVAVIGGLTALMGIFLLQWKLGTTELALLHEAAVLCADKTVLYIAGGCILFGFGAKAGMYPLHIWLPKAHPVAPAPASALLSGVLTKSGVWGILAISCNIFRHDPAWGTVILTLGTVTMFLGALLALFSIDLKRTLACSSMSQIGFILIGVGMMGLLGEENALAARGTLLHMMNHSLFKLLLFMCAGAVYMNVHALDLNKVKGFGHKKPFLNACFLLGAAGIAGIPGLNGYISKTLLHESIVEGAAEYGPMLTVAEWIFLISGGLTLAYMTKLYVCIFIDKKETETAESLVSKKPVREASHEQHEVHHGFGKNGTGYMSFTSYIAIGGAAAVLPALGLTAVYSMNKIADIGTDFMHAGELEHAVHYYSLESLKGGFISIAIGVLVYFLIVRKLMIKQGKYINLWPAWLDLEDLIYRPLLLKLLPAVCGFVSRIFAEALDFVIDRKWVTAVLGFISHVIADSVDALILLLRKTVFRNKPLPVTNKVLNSPAYKVGDGLDRIRVKLDRESEDDHTFARLSYRVWDTFRYTSHNLMDSVSFALLLLCLTIVAVLIYVLFIRQ